MALRPNLPVLSPVLRPKGSGPRESISKESVDLHQNILLWEMVKDGGTGSQSITGFSSTWTLCDLTLGISYSYASLSI